MNMITGIKDQIDNIYAILKNSSPIDTELYPSVPIEHIKRFEEMFRIKLPLDYKYLLSLSNGFYYDGHEILGISFNSKDTRYDLTATYNFEHYESENAMFSYIVPFYPDGFGNFVCFDTRIINKDGTCPIVFWNHNVKYNEINGPEIINDSFVGFLVETIFEKEV